MRIALRTADSRSILRETKMSKEITTSGSITVSLTQPTDTQVTFASGDSQVNTAVTVSGSALSRGNISSGAAGGVITSDASKVKFSAPFTPDQRGELTYELRNRNVYQAPPRTANFRGAVGGFDAPRLRFPIPGPRFDSPMHPDFHFSRPPLAESPQFDWRSVREMQDTVLRESHTRLEELRIRSIAERERDEQRERREVERERMRLEELRIKLEADEREREREERERERKLQEARMKLEADERERERQLEKLRLENEVKLAEVKREETLGQAQPYVGRPDKNFKLPDFDESKMDIDTYLKQFERAAAWLQWPKETWNMRLSVHLKGEARNVFDTMREDDVDNYPLLKESLLKFFKLTPATYRKKFLLCRKEENETFPQMLARLELYFQRWLTLAETPSTFEALRELLLTEQLYSACSKELALFVRERKPKTALAAAEHAETYLDVRRAERVRQQTQPANQSDWRGGKKKKKDGDGKPPASNETEDSKVKGEGTTRSAEHVTCFHCRQKGHYRRECPDKDKPAKQASLTLSPSRVAAVGCYNPEVEGEVNGKTVTILRDTGAEISLVNARLVSVTEPALKEVIIVGVRGEGGKYPVHLVEIDTPFWKGRVEAAVMDDLNVQAGLVLGNSIVDENGDSHAVSVLRKEPLFSASAVTTRSQARREEKGQQPLRIGETGLGQVDLAKEQRDDSSLNRFFKLAEEGDAVKTGRQGTVKFSVKGGYLRREFRGKDGEFVQIVVPQKLREKVMTLAHDTPMAGHLGGKKTLDRIWRHFYWPGMCADVRRWCASCERCQRTTPKGLTKKVPLGEMPIVEEPFRRVAADLIGPISPPSDRKHRFILVVVDYATRYPEATPLKNIDAETVAEALWTMWTRVGVPAEILTDNGSQFVGGTMQEVNRLLAMKGLRCAPFHAQCNGLCEKYNGTLKQMLRRLCGDRPQDWDRYIPALLFAYREVPQESLGYSPFELLYGRAVRGPLQILKELWTKPAISEEVRTPSEYVLDLRERITDVCEIAHANLREARKRQATLFNKKAKERSFAVGSRVLLLLPTKHNKLEMEWRGPYQVLERVGNLDYRIDVRGKAKLYHANMLKQFVERVEPGKSGSVSAVRAEKPAGSADSCGIPVAADGEGLLSPSLLGCGVGEGSVMTAVVGVASVVDDEDSEAAGGIPVLSTVRKEGPADVHIDSELSTKQKKEVLELCRQFDSTLTDIPGRTSLLEFTIEMEDPRPIFVKPYPLPFAKAEVVKKEVDSMLRLGVIERAASPYNSPTVLVAKPDGSVRYCQDFREINRKVVFDGEPLPDPELLFSKVSKARYFSKVDLSKGYWQLVVRKKDRPITAFSTPRGQFQWCVMPFGISTAVAVFSRMMRLLLEPLGRDDILNFMDDCLVATETWEAHLEALKTLFRRLKETGLTARPTKCYLGYRELDYLGHRIGHGCVWPEPGKVEKIRTARRPETKKELRSTLGLFGYYRKFIPSYAAIALPLTDLTRKKLPEKLQWTSECEIAFQTLKEKLCSEPILRLPDVTRPFTLRTDASGKRLGATLLQEHDGTLFPVSFDSKKLTPAEMNYSTVERECLGIVRGVRKFEVYLYGQKFTLETDQASLQYLRKAKHDNSRLMRWALFLQNFTFVVRAIPGKENVVADYLSRFAVDRN